MYQVGIDVSKKKLDICLLVNGMNGKRKTKVIKNNLDSAKTLIEWLDKQECFLKEVRIILESTGIYHEQLCNELYDIGLHVSIVNPYRIREFAKGIGILTKTDKVDSFALACYGELKKPPVSGARLEHYDGGCRITLRFFDHNTGHYKNLDLSQKELGRVLNFFCLPVKSEILPKTV